MIVPVIRTAKLDATVASVEAHGGRVVVPVFEMGGLGKGCYITDPAGVLVGLHFCNPPREVSSRCNRRSHQHHSIPLAERDH